VVIVRDEEWLVTSMETSDDATLLSVQGLSELVRGTSATFYDTLDDIEVHDPAGAQLVGDDSPGYRRSRLWLEATARSTQFAVLYGYDHNEYTYDANGRLVPNAVLKVWRAKGDRITAEERTHTNQAGYTYVYELPFGILDREEDMRRAYAEFERRLTTKEATA
jgi:hypothetical protein